MRELVSSRVQCFRAANPTVRTRVVFQDDTLYGGNESPCLCDRWKIMQVLDNLLRNAGDAIPSSPHPTVLVRVRATETAYRVEVIDNGVGIPRERVNRVFRPFFTTKPGGNGFGLAVCFKIIEEHGGAIDVVSRERFYTAVRFTLPRAEIQTEP